MSKSDLLRLLRLLSGMESLMLYNGMQHLNQRAHILRDAVKRLHAAKGRYHTQLAICDLLDLFGLKNERPKK